MININLNMVIENWYFAKEQIMSEIGNVPFKEIQWVYDNQFVELIDFPENPINSIASLVENNFVMSIVKGT